jgi:hypothetical protein
VPSASLSRERELFLSRAGRDRPPARLHHPISSPARYIAAYLPQRYVIDGADVEDLAAELGAASSAVVAETDRAGVPQHPRGERMARTRRSP